MEKNGSKFRIINVYRYTDMNERVLLFQSLQPLLCSGRQIIIGGDFNCTLEKRASLGTAPLAKRDVTSYAMKNFIKDCNLKDTSLNLDDPGYTWSNGKN